MIAPRKISEVDLVEKIICFGDTEEVLLNLFILTEQKINSIFFFLFRVLFLQLVAHQKFIINLMKKC